MVSRDDPDSILCGEGFWVVSRSHFSLWELPPGSAFSLGSYTVIDGLALTGGNIIRLVETDPESGWIRAELLRYHGMTEKEWIPFWLSIDDVFRLERNARIGNYGE